MTDAGEQGCSILHRSLTTSPATFSVGPSRRLEHESAGRGGRQRGKTGRVVQLKLSGGHAGNRAYVPAGEKAYRAPAGVETRYKRNCWIDSGGAFSGDAVCVRRTNFACTGLNVMIVGVPEPCPSATGVQVVPFSDVSTL